MGSHERAVRPELTPEQIAIKELGDQLLAMRPEHEANVTISCAVKAKEVEERIKSSPLARLLLPEGASLLEPYWYGVKPKNDLIVGEVEPKGVQLRGWGFNVSESGEHIIYGPIDGSTREWSRTLEIMIGYGLKEDDFISARQILTTSAYDEMPVPILHRDVWAASRAEMGYGGHNELEAEEVTPEDIQTFTQLAQELFEARAGEPY